MHRIISLLHTPLSFLPQTLASFPQSSSLSNPNHSPFKVPLISILSSPFSHSSSRQRKEDAYNDDASLFNRDPNCPPKLFVVQPRVRPNTLLQVKLNEAMNLANSLEEQRDGCFDTELCEKELPPHVVQNLAVRSPKARADTYFGPGTVETIKCHLNAVESQGELDAVFVNTILSGIQQRNLERAWGKPVLDRVGLIIEIFNAHAQTKEAKLQAELAALMYKKTRLVLIRGLDGRYTFGGTGEAEVVSARGWEWGSFDRKWRPPRTDDAGERTQEASSSYTHLLQCHPKTPSIEQVHARIIIEGSFHNSFYVTHLVKSYAKVGNFLAARVVFELVPVKSTFLYNAMIRACCRNEEWFEVAELYRRMEVDGFEPDHYTLPFVIKSFSMISAIEEGKRIHDLAKRTGLICNVHVATALIEMYVEFDEINTAYNVFDIMPERDVVAWTAIISGYVKHGNYNEALSVFREMRLGDEKPNWVTVLSLIPACDRSIHAFVIKSGFNFSAEVETTILNMYAKSGDVMTAHGLFIQMSAKSLVSWSAMVGGYSQNGYAHEALCLFHQMLKTTDHRPDAIIAASVLQACAQLGLLHCGEMIHGCIIRAGVKTEQPVETALINMYAKCGNINAAEGIFKEISDQSVIAWSSLIAGYGYHGLGRKALNLFEQMKSEGFVPDELAFLSVLSACSHSGLVTEGKACFDSMMKTYNMLPEAKHYACMVDLLGRAGLIDEACNLTKEMQIQPDASVWGALLSACRVKGDIKVAEFACGRMLELDQDNTDYYVLLANVYASCGKWDKMSKVRSTMRSGGERKTPGYSYIEVNRKSHAFFAGDSSHPEFKKICSMLEMVHSFSSEAVDLLLKAEHL